MANANQMDSEYSDWCDNETNSTEKTELSTELVQCKQNYYDVAFVFGPFDTSNDNYEKYEQNYLDYCDIKTSEGIQINFY